MLRILILIVVDDNADSNHAMDQLEQRTKRVPKKHRVFLHENALAQHEQL